MNWVYADSRGVIQAANKNDMSGNTGWKETASAIPETLTNERGIGLYRLDGSAIVQREQADIEADYTPPTVEPSQTERIAQLEQQNELLTECVLEMSALLYE